jgi:uroporphyrinogen decarboxylase
VIREARRVRPEIKVKYHSDGQLTDLLPELIEIGVEIVNPVQPECMDLAEIKRRFGEELVLWGCMPVQSLYAHGSAEDVRRHLVFLMDEIAVGGGMVVNFINFLWTDRSRQNLRTFYEVFYELGRYG